MAEKKQNRILTTYDIAKELRIPVFNHKRFVRFLWQCLEANRPLYVQGPPGCGKTEAITAFAEAVRYFLIVTRLNGHEPVDFGLPKVYQDKHGVWRHLWTVPDMFHSEAEDIPEGYKGWMWFGDEFSQAVPATQNRFGEMLNEHTLNSVRMHPDVYMVLASNFMQNKAATYPVPSFIRRRVAMCALAPNWEDFEEYCTVHDIHEDIPAFVKFRLTDGDGNNPLDCFNPDETVNCTPASLCALSPYLKKGIPGDMVHDVLASNIGESWGTEFEGYLGAKAECPTIEEIEKRPDKTPIPDDERVDLMCAVAAMVGRALKKENATPLVKYLVRMPPEYCVFAMRDAARREPKIRDTKAFVDWAVKHGDVLE